jgi:cysteine desulfurase
VGALYARKGVEVTPLSVGGSQERGLRPGTLNVPGIVGMGAAAELAHAAAEDADLLAAMTARRDRFERQLARIVPERVVNGAAAERAPTTSNVAFPGLSGDTLLMLLSELGVCCSTGAACSSSSRRTSPVLAAMAVPEALAAGSLRFSFARTTTDAELDLALERIASATEQLRALEPS